MMFSISVVASFPGLDLTVTVEAKQLQADGRGSIRMLGGGLPQKLGKTKGLVIMSPKNPYHILLLPDNTPLTYFFRTGVTPVTPISKLNTPINT